MKHVSVPSLLVFLVTHVSPTHAHILFIPKCTSEVFDILQPVNRKGHVRSELHNSSDHK